MSASTNRADLINKLFKVAKKHFDPIKPPADRPVMEHMLYACCLEDSDYEAADEAFARLQQDFLNWNEVRVTTVTELAGVMKKLYEPKAAALRFRQSLHGMFEAHYQFDLEFLKKENLGKAVQTIESYRGTTPFIVSYTAQAGLGGHSIPVDDALLLLLYTIGVINESEMQKRKIPGLSRVIPKAKGVEFGSVVHQLAVAFYKSKFNKNVREIILQIAPDAKDRFPKRGAKKVEPVVEEKPKKAATKTAGKEPKSSKAAKATSKTKAPKKTVKKKAATAAPKKKAAPKKAAAKKAAPKKKSAKKKTTTKASKKAAKKTTKKKSPTKRLARKKPR
jgi:endonuclease-3